MRAHLTSLRAHIGMVAAVVCFASFCVPPLIGSEKPRPISSLSTNERAQLPGNTQVTLKSGKTVTLGMLRAEHEARLQRFSKAETLGKVAAGRLKPVHPSTAMHTNPSETGKAGSSPVPGKMVINKAVTPAASTSMPFLATFHLPACCGGGKGSLAKDYVDFCKAANPSACLYLPANIEFENMSGNTWFVDIDYLITDRSICEYDGGWFREPVATSGPDSGYSCVFYYPALSSTEFKPTGPLDTKAACDPPARYIVDPKGAVQASYPPDSEYITTIGPKPVTCVVQVWIGGK